MAHLEVVVGGSGQLARAQLVELLAHEHLLVRRHGPRAGQVQLLVVQVDAARMAEKAIDRSIDRICIS